MIFHSFFFPIIFSGFIFISNLQTLGQWIKLESPVDTFLRNLIFVDSLTGWAAGENGKIIHTTDGGITWDVQNTNVESFITDIFFINKNVGWSLTFKEVFPFNPIILKTTTGGNEWISKDYPDSSVFMTTIFFLDSLTGFIGGTYITKTTDGGDTWIKASIDSSMLSSLPIYKFKFYDKNFGYACGGAQDLAGVVWRTTNRGLNWSVTPVSSDEVFDLFIIDSLNAFTLSGDPEGFFNTGYIKTTDAGETWTYDELQFFGLSFALSFRTTTEGWSASGYKFLLTTDMGIIWNETVTPEGSGIFDLQFTDSLTGYAVGEGGIILKFTPPPVSVEEDELRESVYSKEVSSSFVLYQNYPNPFNPLTVIRWELAFDSYVTLKVFDLIGQEVAILINKNLKAGAHNIEYNASGLNSGVYFYTIKAIGVNTKNNVADGSNFISTKKMLLLR
jgi:photosystem II stability/assembly factor-like uncharacterized protein